MTDESAGWLFVILLYYAWTYVLPTVTVAGLIYGAYRLGRRKRGQLHREVNGNG